MIRPARATQVAAGGTPNARPSTRTQTAHPQFEYVGKTALTVVSPLTGRQYRFAQPGARLDVDVKDRSWLAFVPNLQRVS
jgi:hypothetical protein